MLERLCPLGDLLPLSLHDRPTGTITLIFNSLAVATKYLGSVAYSGATSMPNPTIVRVDTP